MRPFDRLRLFHWSLAGLFALAWLSGDDGELLHVWASYGLLVVLLLRPLLALLRIQGFPDLLPARREQPVNRIGRWLSLAMLASFLLTGLLGLGLVDNGAVLGSALTPFWPGAGAALGGSSFLDLSGWLDEPEELHEFMANLSLALVAAHSGWALIWRRRMAWALLKGTPPPAAARPVQPEPLQVLGVSAQTATAVDIELQVPASRRGEFAAARPGQFISIAVPCTQPALWRSYSLSRLPDSAGRLRISVRRVEGGRASNWLADQLRAGMTLAASGPAGEFSPARLDGELLLLGAGSGITPLLPIARAALAQGGRVCLLQVERNAASRMLRHELQALALQYPQQLRLQVWLSDEQGLLDGASLLERVAAALSCEVFLCGPPAFMAAMGDALQAAGVPAARLHREQFVAAQPALALDGVAQAVAVEVDGQRHRVEVAAGEVLLSAMERAGLPAPGGCRSGVCQSCRCQVKSGRVNTASSLPADLPAGWTLACQATPAGSDLEVVF